MHDIGTPKCYDHPQEVPGMASIIGDSAINAIPETPPNDESVGVVCCFDHPTKSIKHLPKSIGGCSWAMAFNKPEEMIVNLRRFESIVIHRSRPCNHWIGLLDTLALLLEE
ncbi:MAG: hypothetical protein OXE55_07125 [Flavobacteriaceae bacterium]|nr:hypothetical protein [Flavobacteriaceae bacterium]MCY4254188.1 hypothetical protein [Flavobacteriaceae bacterium]